MQALVQVQVQVQVQVLALALVQVLALARLQVQVSGPEQVLAVAKSAPQVPLPAPVRWAGRHRRHRMQPNQWWRPPRLSGPVGEKLQTWEICLVRRACKGVHSTSHCTPKRCQRNIGNVTPKWSPAKLLWVSKFKWRAATVGQLARPSAHHLMSRFSMTRGVAPHHGS